MEEWLERLERRHDGIISQLEEGVIVFLEQEVAMDAVPGVYELGSV